MCHAHLVALILSTNTLLSLYLAIHSHILFAALIRTLGTIITSKLSEFHCNFPNLRSRRGKRFEMGNIRVDRIVVLVVMPPPHLFSSPEMIGRPWYILWEVYTFLLMRAWLDIVTYNDTVIRRTCELVIWEIKILDHAQLSKFDRNMPCESATSRKAMKQARTNIIQHA